MGCAFAAAAPASHATHYRINALVKHSRQPLRASFRANRSFALSGDRGAHIIQPPRECAKGEAASDT